MTEPEPRRRWVYPFLTWSALVLAVVFSAYVRIHLLQCPLERDEGEYAYSGQLILQGIPPYKLAYNMKLPGTYLAYAVVMAAFGQTTGGIHFGLLLVNCLTIVMVFLFARDLFDARVGALAALAYSILSASSDFLGTAGHATHYVLLFALPGVWLLWKTLRTDNLARLFIAGLLLGIGFLMKQQAVFMLAFGGVAVLVANWFSASRNWRRLSARIAIYCAGAVLPYAVICGWLWYAGVFDKFWFWTVMYAREYVSVVPLRNAAASIWHRLAPILASHWPIIGLAAIGLATLAWSIRRESMRSCFVMGLLVATFLCTCPGFYFREHYFIVMLPVVAMLFGVGACALYDMAARRGLPGSFLPFYAAQQKSLRERAANGPKSRGIARHRFWIWPAGALVATALLLPIWWQRNIFFLLSAQETCRKIYGANPFPECEVIADYIKSNTNSHDRIAVLGSEPELYFLSNRISVTGYIYTYGLMDVNPLALQMQKELRDDIESAMPPFLVSVNVPTSWMGTQKSEKMILDWFRKFVKDHYQVVGIADLISDEWTDYRWGEQAFLYRPKAQYFLTVFKRKN